MSLLDDGEITQSDIDNFENDLIRKTDGMIKGRIAETIAEEMFKNKGFYVMKFGKEHTLNPLTNLQQFIYSCGGKFKLKHTDTSKQISKIPDFVIVNKEGEVYFMEVKYRYGGNIGNFHGEFEVLNLYPNTFLLVINTEFYSKKCTTLNNMNNLSVSESNELEKTKFHVWFNEEKFNKKTQNTNNTGLDLTVLTLKQFLNKKLKINYVFLDIYEKIVEKWIPSNKK